MLMNDRRTFLKTAAMAAATAVAETSLGKVPRSIALPLLGSFNDLAVSNRSSIRHRFTPSFSSYSRGVRPARALSRSAVRFRLSGR